MSVLARTVASLKRLGVKLGSWLRPAWMVVRPVALPVWNALSRTVSGLGDNNADLMAAGLAFYALISIAPLLVIAVAIVGEVVGHDLAQSEIRARVAEQLGDKLADLVTSLVEATAAPGAGVIATMLSVVALLLASSRLFGTVASAVNTLWGVPERGKQNVGHAVWRYVRGKLLSFAGVAVVGIIFLGLIGLRFVLTFAKEVSHDFSFLASISLWAAVENVMALAILTGLFAVLFRVLPDRRLAWKPLWIGAAITALLLLVGRALIASYLGTATIESAYGAAGSVVVFLFWSYYSALAFLFGAKLTYVMATPVLAPPVVAPPG